MQQFTVMTLNNIKIVNRVFRLNLDANTKKLKHSFVLASICFSANSFVCSKHSGGIGNKCLSPPTYADILKRCWKSSVLHVKCDGSHQIITSRSRINKYTIKESFLF